MTFPRPTSAWQHTNGNVYTVLCIANEFTERPEQYPPTVVYMGLNGRIWSRLASDWARSMTLVKDAEDAPAAPAQAAQYDPSRPVSASNLPESMTINPAAAGSFLSRWRDVIQQLPVSRDDGEAAAQNGEDA
ncbi:hypothetical protein [Burkholderia ubonensis]|uniref:hypothetical protein n=1 Tax=Burkholderia ubonensis TaxID=101571 RepID=UPI0007C87B1F|nr:hypothetical protein [Burkholderia ubonensis]